MKNDMEISSMGQVEPTPEPLPDNPEDPGQDQDRQKMKNLPR
jgi:hypothetical protein